MKHEQFMQRAIELALKGYGQTSPNPLVGAVLVKGGKTIAEGYHKGAGQPHAEAAAIKNAKNKCKGATLYINLEPCCHFGRTPPCTDLIIRSGIKEVVYGMRDPNPVVNGKGLKKLKNAGIKVTGPVFEDACLITNLPFVKWITTGTPFVTAKIAMTLDGKIADASGDSKWISSESSRHYAHVLRAGSDIVMVGANTAKKDKPKLNVRIKGYKGKQPLSLVIKSSRGKKVDLKLVLKELGNAGFQSVLVEGGGKLHSDMIKRGLIDHFVIFIAPKLLGGLATPWTHDIGASSMRHIRGLHIIKVFRLENDIVIEAVPSQKNEVGNRK